VKATLSPQTSKEYQKHLRKVVLKHGDKCYYCGDPFYALDHFVPRRLGGTDGSDNLVPACAVCNSIKGNRSFEESRWRLVLRAIKWPKFTLNQIAWLRERGFDLSQFDTAKLRFES
jgi:5-methylcytosine-specific restriction endonuclease McrA